MICTIIAATFLSSKLAVPNRRHYTERMKNKNWIEDWAKQYDVNGKLPETMIPCSTEGCDTKTTCCSTNLKSKVAATEGGVRALLSDFKCRSCRGKTKVVTMPVSTSGESVPVRKRAAKKTVTKAAQKLSRVEELNAHARAATVNVNAVPLRINFEDAEAVRQLTDGACQRPDIYLDNDRACDGCSLYELCACAAKQLLADSGRKKVVAGPRRKK